MRKVAADNRAQSKSHGTKVVNKTASPGAGKTTLPATIAAKAFHRKLGVIEGDVTKVDEDRDNRHALLFRSTPAALAISMRR